MRIAVVDLGHLRTELRELEHDAGGSGAGLGVFGAGVGGQRDAGLEAGGYGEVWVRGVGVEGEGFEGGFGAVGLLVFDCGCGGR